MAEVSAVVASPDPLVSILIPTTGRRPGLLAQVTAEYHRQHAEKIGPPLEVLTIEGVTWGTGLNTLMETARGEYMFCGCDDIWPWEGWFYAARHYIDAHQMPASRYLNRDHSPMHLGCDDAAAGVPVAWCRSYLLTRECYEEVGPFTDNTWWCDIDYSERLNAKGWPIVGCPGYTFTHLDGDRDWQVGDWEERERAAYNESHRRMGWGGG